MEFLEIDGSRGEGGGQILRTALAFSIIKSRPVRVTNIRAGRENPGLRRQHISALSVLGRVFDAELEGVFEGSSKISFVPGLPRTSDFSLDTKTAASITLVLQAVVPAVALTGSRLSLDLVGGTDVPWSPTFDYFDRVVRPAYASLGVNFSMTAETRGYYPRGGGKVHAVIEPCPSVHAINCQDVSPPRAARIVSRCAVLPKSVADRQLKAAKAELSVEGITVEEVESTEASAISPGSSILASIVENGIFLGSDAIGAKGRPAEDVGSQAGRGLAGTTMAGACIDDNLADMLVPLLSLAREKSEFRVRRVTPHLETSLFLARAFASCDYSSKRVGTNFIVKMEPK